MYDKTIKDIVTFAKLNVFDEIYVNGNPQGNIFKEETKYNHKLIYELIKQFTDLKEGVDYVYDYPTDEDVICSSKRSKNKGKLFRFSKDFKERRTEKLSFKRDSFGKIFVEGVYEDEDLAKNVKLKSPDLVSLEERANQRIYDEGYGLAIKLNFNRENDYDNIYGNCVNIWNLESSYLRSNRKYRQKSIEQATELGLIKIENVKLLEDEKKKIIAETKQLFGQKIREDNDLFAATDNQRLEQAIQNDSRLKSLFEENEKLIDENETTMYQKTKNSIKSLIKPVLGGLAVLGVVTGLFMGLNHLERKSMEENGRSLTENFIYFLKKEKGEFNSTNDNLAKLIKEKEQLVKTGKYMDSRNFINSDKDQFLFANERHKLHYGDMTYNDTSNTEYIIEVIDSVSTKLIIKTDTTTEEFVEVGLDGITGSKGEHYVCIQDDDTTRLYQLNKIEIKDISEKFENKLFSVGRDYVIFHER